MPHAENAASVLGRIGGSRKSERKTAACRANLERARIARSQKTAERAVVRAAERAAGAAAGKTWAETSRQGGLARAKQLAAIRAAKRWPKTRPNGGRTPEYQAYCSARERCTNPKCGENWPRYGGRGIEFRFTSYEQFMDELGLRPEGHQLDRIDNDGHYEPGNVRWATPKQNTDNRRCSKPAETPPLLLIAYQREPNA